MSRRIERQKELLRDHVICCGSCRYTSSRGCIKHDIRNECLTIYERSRTEKIIDGITWKSQPTYHYEYIYWEPIKDKNKMKKLDDNLFKL